MPLGILMTSYECHCYLAYYHKLSMTSSKHKCILTSNIKMSAREYTGDSSEREEEEELVRRVGGRGRSLIQAV